MADVKISQLPAATTPVDGTEVLPIVQSATTKQVSIANLTAGRAMSASSLTLTTPLAVTSGGTGLAVTGAGTFIVSGSANTISATATPTLGVQQTTQGTLTLANTAAGAWPVTLQSSNSATAAWTMTLPTAPAAANGYILTSSTTGVTSWTNPTALGVDLDVGTTAITNGTAGRVFFQGSGDVLQQSANLFWDNTNSYLGIGTASPSSALTVSGLATFAKGSTSGITIGDVSTNSNSQLRLQGTSAGNNFLLANNFNVAGLEITPSTATGGTTYSNPVYSVTGAGLHKWYYGTTNSMTLDASGNLGIGTSSPAVKLDVNGTIYAGTGDRLYLYSNNVIQAAGTLWVGTNGAAALQFATSNTEAMRLDTNGNLLVGTTSVLASSTMSVVTAGSSSITMRNSGATAGLFWQVGPDSSSTFKIYNASNAGVFMGDGATSWSSSSDERLKNIVSEISGATSKINALRAVNFTWKADTENTPHVGLIAQDVQNVLPEAVSESDGYLGVAYSDVIPLLVASIKELAAKVQALEAKVA